MAGDDFLTGLIKKALVSAASAAGSKLGGKAASYVLDILGLGDDELDEIKETLNTISDQVKQTDDKVSKLMDEVKWQNATDSFDSIWAAITTHTDKIADLLAISDKAKRDAQINKYVTTANPPINGLDTDLTLIHNRIMGKGDGLTGTVGEPLMKTYLDTHWGSVWDSSPAKTYANILSVYLHSVQMQRLATTLLVTYWQATDQPELAQDASPDLEKRLVAQFQVMAKALPSFVALNALNAPRVQMNFTELQIAPNYVSIDNGCLIPASSHTSYTYWQLTRMTADPATPKYILSMVGSGIVAELVKQIPVNEYDVGAGAHTISHYDYETAHLLNLAVTANALIFTLIFSIETTDQQNVLRLKLADGRTLGYINRYYSGYTFELTDTEATTTNGLATLANFTKVPSAPQPTLSAWSRAYSNTPQGEGGFTPGYRVRYRVISVNRFGESDKGDWLLAPKPEDSQDKEFYFGNHNYYFPQIQLHDPEGRTEAYRVFRQFHGGAEEEVTAGGTFTGDPQSGNPVIFDDFTP